MELLEALFTITKTRKPWKCPSTDEWINKFGTYIYNGMLVSHKKKNKILPSARAWMQPEAIILSEVNQKDKYHMISLVMWDLKYGTNKPIYKTETDS